MLFQVDITVAEQLPELKNPPAPCQMSIEPIACIGNHNRTRCCGSMEKTIVSEINAYMRNSGISIIIKENEISANKVFFAVDSLPSGIV